MKISDIKNIEGVAPTGGFAGLRWQCGDFRYHIWLDEQGQVRSVASRGTTFPALYKNPVDRDRYGGNQTKVLDAMNNANASAVHYVMAQNRGGVLVEAARAAYAAKEAARLAAEHQAQADKMRAACVEFAAQEQGKGYDEALQELCALPDASLLTLARIMNRRV